MSSTITVQPLGDELDRWRYLNIDPVAAVIVEIQLGTRRFVVDDLHHRSAFATSHWRCSARGRSTEDRRLPCAISYIVHAVGYDADLDAGAGKPVRGAHVKGAQDRVAFRRHRPGIHEGRHHGLDAANAVQGRKLFEPAHSHPCHRQVIFVVGRSQVPDVW